MNKLKTLTAAITIATFGMGASAAMAQQLQMQAQEKMLAAVKDNDMGALTYNAIAACIQTDTELQKRVSALQ